MKEFIAAGVQIAAKPNKIKDNIEKSLGGCQGSCHLSHSLGHLF